MGQSEVDGTNAIADLGLTDRLLVWCRATSADLVAAQRCRVHGAHFSLPVSDTHLEAWRKSWDWVLHTMRTLAKDFRNAFAYMTVGAQDASRADLQLLKEFTMAAQETV